MTKTLTEQWRDGELKDGLYYCKSIYGIEELCLDDRYFWYPLQNEGEPIDVQEVLAPVSSYDELTLMAGNYRLAKKALRDCYNEMNYWATMNHRCLKIFNHIKAALEEMEGVK